MLADKIVAHGIQLKNDPGFAAGMASAYGLNTVKTVLKGSFLIADQTVQRYILSPQIAELTSKLATTDKTLKAISKQVVLPSEDMWIEWTLNNIIMSEQQPIFDPALSNGIFASPNARQMPNSDARLRKMGMIIAGQELTKDEPRIRSGDVVVFVETEKGEIGLCTAFNIHFETGNVQWGTDRRTFITKDIPLLSAFLVAACAVINTPRIFERNENDLSRLNKAREKNGKEPLLNYIEIAMPKDTAVQLKGASFGEVPEHKKGARKRHHVDTFVRISQGVVQLVRPHWRGSAALGYSSPSKIVKHKGERVKREGVAGTITR